MSRLRLKGSFEYCRPTLTRGSRSFLCDLNRRIQHPWASLYPYADSRSLDYAHEIGLLKEGLPEKDYTAPEDMDDLILKRSKDLLAVFREEGDLGVAEGGDGEREKFVRLLDVLVGLGLQKQLVEARKRAASGGAADGGGEDVKEEREADTAET